MSKKYLYLLLLLISGFSGFGQNLPQFTHYIFNPFYYNPGAAGQSNRTQIQSTLRSQYFGYSPTESAGGNMLSSNFSVDMPVSKLKGGMGLQVANQNISRAQSKSELMLSYAYHKKVNSNVIGLGLGVGVNNLSLRGSDYIIRDPNDPIIPQTDMSSITPQVNAGIYIVNPSYQIGLSAKNILESNYSIAGVDGNFKEKRDYYLTGKYDFPISYTLDISPMFMVRSDLVTTTTNVGLMGTYNQNVWLGINYRLDDAASLLLGANVLENKLKIGYAIDLVTQGVRAKSNMSHEIFLRYSFATMKSGKKSIVKTPRYNIQ